jgi:NAD(P)-dependent dehydrogenase (short-subunit alcohol dehydrogenase family)
MSVPDNEETLNGRRVIATGGTPWLGRSIFEALLARGADVTVVGAMNGNSRKSRLGARPKASAPYPG